MTERIKELREARGWSQAELAQRAKIRGASSISELERGKGNPMLSTLSAIADALGVHVLELFIPPEGSEVAEIVNLLMQMDEAERAALLHLLRLLQRRAA